MAAVRRLAPPLPSGIGYSGGADSTALLIAGHQLWPGGIHAIHVHHGLQAAADGFERHCRAVCDQLGVPLKVVRVDANHRPGESPEDAARNARYAALAETALALRLHAVLLGHHADDQVETMLLALSRGAGLPGLAAMAERFERSGMQFLRPLLGIESRALREWIAAQQVAVVEDATNTDTSFTRNRIRHEILPALARSFPHFRETFARSARHAAQAQELLNELAANDLNQVGSPPKLTELRKLRRIRQANVLRHWLRRECNANASTAQLEELLDQVEACTTRGHAIAIKVGAGRVELRDGALRYVAAG